MTGTFLWGASSSGMQIEGNNVNSDWWANELRSPGMEPSGDAVDSYHRYREDMQLLADAGLTAYRFGIEWARIEPVEGRFSRAELAHYRRMIDFAFELGLTPVVTLHHFTAPRWFAEDGGWTSERAVDRFASYVTQAATILDGVEWVVTINEPNMLAIMGAVLQLMSSDPFEWQSPTVDSSAPESEDAAERPAFVLPDPDPELGAKLGRAHRAAVDILREKTSAKVGWSIASQAFEYIGSGDKSALEKLSWVREDLYLEASKGDDFVGVQSYSVIQVDENGIVPHIPAPGDTLVGTPFRPDAVAVAVRHTWEATGGIPILITENGIATADDARRIEYTEGALHHLKQTIDEGIDVRGYLHWSLLDNYEWGHWGPTFGLIAVDRETFVRTPKPSLAWLGRAARDSGL